MAKEKKKSKVGSHIASISFFTLMGVVLGFAMISFLEWQLPEGIESSEKAYRICAMLVFLYLSWFIHIVIHESGHLLGGLLSGYTFSSFRIGSFMLLKENGKLVSKRLKIAGTGGQCLMAPPEMVDGKFPVVLYNMGGSVMNLLVSLLFVPVLIATPKGGFLALLSFLMIGMGIISGLGNGIPLHTKTIDNDGYNAISLGKSKDAMRTFPSVIRTEYAYALLVEKDRGKAAKAMEAFEKVARTYPYPNDINSERELIELVNTHV